MNLSQHIASIRATSTPLVAVRTVDTFATAAHISAHINAGQDSGEFAVIEWDVVQGFFPRNRAGVDAIPFLIEGFKRCSGNSNMPDEAALKALQNPANALLSLYGAPERACIIMHNLHLLWNNAPPLLQGLLNLRDHLKVNTAATLFLLGNAFEMPLDIRESIILIEEELPDDDALRSIVQDNIRDARVPEPGEDTIIQSINALRGLGAFNAEQQVAMALDADHGLNLAQLWHNTKVAIEETPGLLFLSDDLSFDDVGGLDHLKQFLIRLKHGPSAPSMIVFIDEIEKEMAGAGGDLTGISDDFHSQMLQHMQNTESMGMILVGPPGCLAGDTIININRGGNGVQRPLKTLVERWNGWYRQCGGKPWDNDIPTYVQRAENSVCRLALLENAWESGIQPTYTLTTNTGRTIRATACHPFLTADGGWSPLQGLRPGDCVQVNAGHSQDGPGPKIQYRSRYTKYHPFQRKAKDGHRHLEHRLVIEAELNGLSFNQYLHYLRTDPEKCASLYFLPSSLAVHHKDHDPKNNALDNLQILTATQHAIMHAEESYRNVLLQIGFEKIVSIAEYGEEMTYDLEVADDPHNFIANGFVVHNTGKSLLAKAAGHELGVPTLSFDMGAMRHGIVGESQKAIRNALQIITRKGGIGNTLWIATSNNIESLPDELRRRFKFGTWFVDLPQGHQARQDIWAIFRKKYPDIPVLEYPQDENWTGHDIHVCSELAWRMQVSPAEASHYMVPLAISAAEKIRQLRATAHHRYQCAQRGGVYEQSALTFATSPETINSTSSPRRRRYATGKVKDAT